MIKVSRAPRTKFVSEILPTSGQISATNSGGPGGGAGTTVRATGVPSRWQRGITCFASSLPTRSGGAPQAVNALATLRADAAFPSLLNVNVAAGTIPNNRIEVMPHESGWAIPGAGSGPSTGITFSTFRLVTVGLGGTPPAICTAVSCEPTGRPTAASTSK
jgi:hypothetical protein